MERMKIIPVTITLSLLTLAATDVIAASSFIDPIDGMFDAGEYLAENAYGFLPVPALITDPAVGTGLAVFGLFLHESPEQQQKRKQLAEASIDGGAQLLTPGISVVGGGATDNGTKFGLAAHRQTWAEDSIRYLIGGGYGDINMSYYSQTDLQQPLSLDMNMQGFGVLQKLQYRINNSDLFVGILQKYQRLDLTNRDELANIPPELLDRLADISDTNPTMSALGVIAEYDSLNNFFLPTDGYNYILEYEWYNDAIGSDYDYQTLNIKGLNYWPLSDVLTFGLKAQYQSVSSDTRLPVFAYPYIELRGIPKNRYQGENVGSAEIELMWKLTPRWLLLSFVGTGITGASSSDMWDNDTQTAYGVGFRYAVARRYGLQIGIDIARGPEETAWYVNVGTGF